jgi:hypothetical protein
MPNRNRAEVGEMKQTKYFSAPTQYAGLDAHKAAQTFLADMRTQGYAGYEATYGQHGFLVTYWKLEAAA